MAKREKKEKDQWDLVLDHRLPANRPAGTHWKRSAKSEMTNIR
jgi:hypothetical protein